MPNLVHLGLCLGLAMPALTAGLIPPSPDRVELPVTLRAGEASGRALGVCTIDMVPVGGGVQVRVRTPTSSVRDPGYDQAFSVADADLPLTPAWAQRDEGNGLVNAFTYDGAEIRLELRTDVAPRHSIVYEVAVDPVLQTFRSVRITEFDGEDPRRAAPRSVVECESDLTDRPAS